MSFKGKMVIPAVVESDKEILISNEKQWTIYTPKSLMNLQRVMLSGKNQFQRSRTVGYYLCFWNNKIVETVNRLVVRGGGVEIRCDGSSRAT